MRYVIPLLNFELTGLPSLQVEDGTIGPTPEELGEELTGIAPFSFVFQTDDGAPEKKLLLVLSLLRLYKDGNVGAQVIFDEQGGLTGKTHFVVYRGDSYPFSSKYTLSADELDAFLDHWNTYRNFDCESFAVYQFMIADHEPYDDYMLLKYMLVLENLFLPGENTEVVYKLRSRIAIILGRQMTIQERFDLYTFINDCYKVRSNLVHGSNRTGEIKDKLFRLRAICRQSIFFFFQYGCLDNSQNRKKLIEEMTIFSLPSAQTTSS